MQASDRLLAKRYAQALFEAAQKSGETERVRKDLVGVARALRDRMKSFQHPLIPIEKKKKMHRQAVRGASPLTERFLDLLIEKKRWSLLTTIGASLDKLLDEERKLLRAQVRTALPLGEFDQQKLRRSLEKFTGRAVHLNLKREPALIGGVVVRIGDWVLDASLSNQLRRLRESFIGE